MVLGLIVAFINLRACDLLKSSILLRITRLFQVFALILEQQQGEASSDSYLISKFNLVDLAGSERAKRTKASGKLDSLHVKFFYLMFTVFWACLEKYFHRLNVLYL